MRAIFSARMWRFAKALMLDGFLQRRSLRHSVLAWLSHVFIFTGFAGLLLLHALGQQLVAPLVADYYPTLNPWLLLRDLFGGMVLSGVVLVICRRLLVPGLRATTRLTDRFAIGILAVVLLSGFALLAVKTNSAASYERMVQEYGMLDAPQEALALRSLWARDYGVVFPAGQTSDKADVLALGQRLNQERCVQCHARPQSAFLSYGLARVLRPLSLACDRWDAAQALYYIHFLACFIGLALLPFTKFMHLITAPLLMAFNAAVDRQGMDPAGRAFLRGLELDACAHCGTCSVHCSVATAYRQVPNKNILPSEKLASLAALVRGGGDAAQLAKVRQGAYMCSDCDRCTMLCPVGINLRDLWAALKEDLADAGLGSPYQEAAAAAQHKAEPSRQQEVVPVRMGRFQSTLKLSAQVGNFSECYSCKTCTNACPLVFRTEWPAQELDLLPHQVMFCLALGMQEEAMGARMVWDCLTCYQCQEACPNLVQVTDIFYELRNMASRAARG
ncbi:MAG: 4Fe-4S dicluster domain-containing protein [Thermodesulfobacteriota bacterium]